MIETNPYKIAERYVGMKELPGEDKNNPFIMSFLTLDNSWPQNDETPWCSAFANFCAWIIRCPRSKSLMARSWLEVGKPKPIGLARPGFDVVILKRGTNSAGPEIINAPGHVGFFSGMYGGNIYVLGGNQSDSVKVSAYPVTRLLGVRSIEP